MVPFLLVTLEFDDNKGEYKVAPNADFVAKVNALVAREGLAKDHPIFLMCRSGDRSASAANALANVGYTNVWSLVEGFEGDKDSAGMRAINGWRNAGIPWSYKLGSSLGLVPAKSGLQLL